MTGSEYEPLFAPKDPPVDDLADVRDIFATAAEPFTRSPWSWAAWAILLPAVALATPAVQARYGPVGSILAWCSVIIVGGIVETWALRWGAATKRTTVASWVMRSQANLSFVAVALSAVLFWNQQAQMVPGLCLLVLGHSFLVLGGLAFKPFRRAGWVYQVAGLGALVPGQSGLIWFAGATALGNLSIAVSVYRGR